MRGSAWVWAVPAVLAAAAAFGAVAAADFAAFLGEGLSDATGDGISIHIASDENIHVALLLDVPAPGDLSVEHDTVSVGADSGMEAIWAWHHDGPIPIRPDTWGEGGLGNLFRAYASSDEPPGGVRLKGHSPCEPIAPTCEDLGLAGGGFGGGSGVHLDRPGLWYVVVAMGANGPAHMTYDLELDTPGATVVARTEGPASYRVEEDFQGELNVGLVHNLVPVDAKLVSNVHSPWEAQGAAFGIFHGSTSTGSLEMGYDSPEGSFDGETLYHLVLGPAGAYDFRIDAQQEVGGIFDLDTRLLLADVVLPQVPGTAG